VYAVPYVHVIETAQVVCWDDDVPEHIEVREGTIPLIHLQSLLGMHAPVAMPTLPAIVIGYAGRQFAITCDKVIGPREIVVKELGPLLSPLPLYGGATLSGSGKVQLILDTAVLMQQAYPELQAQAELSDEELATSFGADDSVSMIFHRALVVDDSRAIREATTAILVEAGYLVDTAEDGARAWKLLSEGHYDLVVTDIEMPRLDGFGLIRRMRGDIRLADKPVVVMTARAAAEDVDRVTALGVRSFVHKPVTRRKLFEALKRL
jgi:chemosensory pili system protein ChpA (sensor histidine kinase/response regulator)